MIHLRTPRLIAGVIAGLGCIALAFQSTAATSSVLGLGPQEEQEPVEQEEDHGPLHDSMEVLQAGVRTLRKAIGKPEKKEAAIALCREMEAACLIGFQNVPDPEEDLNGTALLEFTADFRLRMLTVCSTLIEFEIALEKEDKAASKSLYKALGKFKKDGHDIFGGE